MVNVNTHLDVYKDTDLDSNDYIIAAQIFERNSKIRLEPV